MPLSAKGKKVLAAMKAKHGEKGERMFYAMENSDKHKGLKKAAQGAVVEPRRMRPRKPGEKPPVSVAHGQTPLRSRLRNKLRRPKTEIGEPWQQGPTDIGEPWSQPPSTPQSRHKDLSDGYDEEYKKRRK